MKKDTFYCSIVLLLLVTIFAVVKISDVNYSKLVEINKGLTDTIETQRQSHRDVVDQYDREYRKLQQCYVELMEENAQLKEQLNEVETPKYKFTTGEIYMLARCVEAEAGHYAKHKNSQQYIAQVILNRLNSGKFPNTLEKVIYQKRGNSPQFSVAYNGMMDREVSPETLANVYKVIVHGTDLPENVLYFYSASVTENWVNTLNTYKTVEGTVFAYE